MKENKIPERQKMLRLKITGICANVPPVYVARICGLSEDFKEALVRQSSHPL